MPSSGLGEPDRKVLDEPARLIFELAAGRPDRDGDRPRSARGGEPFKAGAGGAFEAAGDSGGSCFTDRTGRTQ
eukprot:9806283-Heterocapsa_arctica.AAC.1